MKKKHFECDSCQAVFKIAFDMDADYYQVKYCPFCGEEISEEDRDEAWDVDDIEH